MRTGRCERARCQALALAHQLALPGAHVATGPAPKPGSSRPPAGRPATQRPETRPHGNEPVSWARICLPCLSAPPQATTLHGPTGHRAGALCPRGSPLRRRHESVCQDSLTLLTRACDRSVRVLGWKGGDGLALRSFTPRAPSRVFLPGPENSGGKASEPRGSCLQARSNGPPERGETAGEVCCSGTQGLSLALPDVSAYRK